LRTGAKQELYTSHLEGKLIIQFQEERCKSSNAAPADICVTALHRQQQKQEAFQHRNLLLLKFIHFSSKIHKLASQGKYLKAVQCLF